MLGSHTDAVRCVAYSSSLNVIVSGSWDKTVRVWAPSGGQVAKVDLPDKVYTMTISGSNSLVVGLKGASRQILTYDLKKLASGAADSLISSKESSLKYPTRCIETAPSAVGDFLAASSTEGRVAIDYSGADAANSYAFKCHRKKESDGSETVFPVHCLAFHPVYGTFVTGGGDGAVCVWVGAAGQPATAVTMQTR